MSQDYLMKKIERWETIADVRVPIDEHDHYLDWNEINEDKTEAKDLTSPYGALHYAVGFGNDKWDEELQDYVEVDRGDWMIVWDFAELPDGRIILHGTCNSDSGGFIMLHEYIVVERDNAAATAFNLIDQAIDLCFECTDGETHDEKGWNQDPWYFVRALAGCLGIEPYASLGYDEARFGEVPKDLLN
jgi:hypothetical protein